MIIGKISENEKKVKFNEIIHCNNCGKKVPGGLLAAGSGNEGLFGSLASMEIEKLESALFNMAIIEAVFGGLAADPHDALKIALGKKEDEVHKIKKSGEAIIEKINKEIATNQINSVPTFRIVQGRQNIYADIAQMIETTKDEVYIATTLDDVSRMYHSTIPEKITICEKNGGTVKLLVDMNDTKLAPFVKRFNATETKIGKLPSKGRLIVQKNKKMIMSDSAASFQHSSSDSDYSLCTNSTEMVDNIFTLCSLLWDKSKSLKTIDVKNFVKQSK